MARPKRTSTAVEFANKRANALASIDTALDLGNSLTLVAFKATTKATSDKNELYNTKLSELDGLLDEIEAEEKSLDDLSGRMLAAVGVKYTKESLEYEKAGGTRTSERKKPLRKPKTPAV